MEKNKDTILSVQVENGGVAILTYDYPGRSTNVIDDRAIAELGAAADRIAADPEIRAAVLIGKPDGFIVGADVRQFSRMKTEEDAVRVSSDFQAVLNKIERLTKPVVAAIEGPCLRGGLETALVCRYRIAAVSAKTLLGLPEVKLGLIPAGGGTVRLPRLIPLDKAVEAILTGRHFRAEQAQKLGLVDEAVPAGQLKAIALRRAAELADGTLAPARRPQPLPPPAMLKTLYAQIRENTVKQTKGLFPASLDAIECIFKGIAEGPEAGYAEEVRRFGKIVFTAPARALTHLFLMDTAAKADRGVSAAVPPLPVRKIGVLGAGIMGAGIAAIKAERGYVVRLKDVSLEAAARGLKAASDVLAGIWLKRPLGEYDFRRSMGLISVTGSFSGFSRVDLVIEAVFEDLELKHRVIRETEAVLPEHAIFASNTSAIPIARLAAASKRPQQFVGMHYFSPVHKMPLVEIVRTRETTPEVVATVRQLCRQCGKTAIVVNDGVGFYTSRVISRYIQEAMWLLEGGASIEDIDRAAESAGFPVGPVTVSDEVGLDTAEKVGKILAEVFEGRVGFADVTRCLVADGRAGRKNGRGFYFYREGKKSAPDPSVYTFTAAGAERKAFSAEDIRERLILAFCNEAALTLQEEVLADPRDGDLGAVKGIGFPANLGGPFFYMDRIGLGRIVDDLKRLESRHGPRYAPAPLLNDMARAEKTFF